ncbi:MAG: triose-phosphate isomerase [Patescibacteria group bacterium]
MPKRRILAGNWKMNPRTGKDALSLFSKISRSLPPIRKTDIVICPPFLYLPALKKYSRKVTLGAQDAFPGDVGPYTGEVSGGMLYELGARYVILGHSERRALGEEDALINKKVKGALAAGLTPILCIGENERGVDHGYFNIVKAQIEGGLDGLAKNLIPKVIIAYEPVWALSTTAIRRDANPTDSREMTIFIRKVLSDITTPDTAGSVRIIYGGSANTKDAREFLEHGGVDGLLAGKASLDPAEFAGMVKICEALGS